MKQKDWKGGKNTFRSLGASNHALETREQHDYYATEPKAVELLVDILPFNNKIWECACGEGHLSEALIKKGFQVKSTDLIDRGYGTGGYDFLNSNDTWDGDIITNPPYKFAEPFVEKALSLIQDGNKVAMFMGIQFLEGKRRKDFLQKNNLKYVFVSSSRLNCAKNGDFKKYSGNSARCYAWYIWEKGYVGETIIKWFN
jgi:hypothetical protein